MNNLSIMLNKDQDFEAKDLILKNAFEVIADKNFRKELESELREKYSISKKSTRTSNIFKTNKFWFSAAAALIMVLAAVFFIKLNLSDVDAYQLAMETKINHPGITKGISDKSQQVQDAISAFNSGDWPKAIQGFEATNSDNAENQFFLGLAYFYNKQYTKSSEILSMPSVRNSLYKQETQWFLGLSFYLSKDFTKAKEYLSGIKIGEWQYENAQKLLHNLD